MNLNLNHKIYVEDILEEEINKCNCDCSCQEENLGKGQCTECYYSHR